MIRISSIPRLTGFVFVSINYRLEADFRVNPNDITFGKIKMPDEARDVALAVAWVRRSIASFGGSSDSIFLWLEQPHSLEAELPMKNESMLCREIIVC